MSPTLLLRFPGGCLLLDPATGALGASWGDGPPRWSTQPLPRPVRPVLTEADVGYLHMWSGVTDVAQPAVSAEGVVCWLVDGDEQPVRVAAVRGHGPSAEWP